MTPHASGDPASSASRRGPRPSRKVLGGDTHPREVADDLDPSWKHFFAEASDGDFAPFGLLKKAKLLDSALRRGFIERCGYHRGGHWQYRLSVFGRAVRDAVVERAS